MEGNQKQLLQQLLFVKVKMTQACCVEDYLNTADCFEVFLLQTSLLC